jgi:hypothetical protein
MVENEKNFKISGLRHNLHCYFRVYILGHTDKLIDLEQSKNG